MTDSTHQLIEAIHAVTSIVQLRIENGERSTHIDAHDLVEVLLSIADRLEPVVDQEPPEPR
ncbi:hypothetical protein KOR42_34520 [Thalassoglobus neptunius]|uniref:Uncharacterized protein n=1 Tax=Thalassoglobus neptunius TaxID=1938619 RepID=A0A5C5WNI5_9PLAN|nr:hypothetical protein [Thalassoglobus neptunius]TWT29555.1 hypothetical protein KOR42_55190 [Thalassoglobus neptunius]TWT51765.1 hypothetical protein KOR42_34520 [Thalassoglobus neptunius]